MGDIDLTRWSRFSNAPVHFSNPGTPEAVGVFNYKDEMKYSVGLEWYATKQFTFRVGFSYDKTPVRSPQFNNLDIPDNDRYLVTAGLRWSPTPKLDIDLGYGHLFERDPVINVTDSQGHNVRGTATASAEILSAAVTLKWGGPKESLVSNAPSGKSVGGYSK